MANAFGVASTSVWLAALSSAPIQTTRAGSRENLKIIDKANTLGSRRKGRKNECAEMLQMRNSDTEVHDRLRELWS